MTYSGSYDLKLVLLSIFIIIFSSYSSFNIILRISVSSGKERRFWIFVGSVILALGIWTMHFIGLLAYDAHLAMTFRIELTALSFLFAWIGSFVVFFTTRNTNIRLVPLIGSATILGVAIIGMHVSGMRSIEMDASIRYNIPIAILSLILAFSISGALLLYSLYIKRSEEQAVMKKIIASVITGIGLSIVYYSAMAAVRLKGVPLSLEANEITNIGHARISLSTDLLAYGVTLATTMIIVSFISMAYSDKNRAERLQRISDSHYQSLVEQNPNLVLTVDQQGLIKNINPIGAELLKYTEEQLQSKSFFSLLNEVDFQKAEQKFFQIQNGPQKSFEASIMDAEGKWIPMFITLVPIIVDRKMEGLFVVARDNTEIIDYKERINKAQQDLIDTIQRQQGMTFKYCRLGNHFIHTLCEGELLHKLGFTSAMIIGKTLHAILTKQEAETGIASYTKAWNGEITTFEGNINGIDFYVTLSPVVKNGRVIEVIGSGVDITERKRAEQILENNEHRLKNILSIMPEGIFLYGADDKKKFLNENAYKLFGLDPVEFEEKLTINNNDIPFLDEDGTLLALEDNPVAITLKTGAMVLGKVMGIKRSNKTTWLSVSTKLLEPLYANDVPQVLVTMSDITSQKETEIKLIESNALRRTIIDSLPTGLIVIGNDRKIMALNRPCYQLFSIQDPIGEVIGQSSLGYFQSFYQNNEEQSGKVSTILANGKPVVDEFETVDKRIFRRGYYPFNMDQELKGHLWTFEDITERKILERSIIRTKEEAVKANLAKSEFLASMSHELRTPLNGILGFSQLLELDKNLTNQQKLFVGEILKGGKHLLNLINEVLDLSRIEAGKLKISTDTIKVGTIIRECINLVGPAAVSKGIRIHNVLSSCSDTYVRVDQIRLRQIVLNLAENAIKYNKEKGEVFITCESHNDFMYIHVRDTGIGIAAEHQNRIFEPFYRINHAHIEGTGIGLPLVKQLIQLMGGNVGVESREGEGSDFWISFPMVQSHQAEPNQQLERNSEYLPHNREYKILYIEDNLSNIQLVSEILGSVQGFTLLSATTGRDGLQLAEEQNVDLILLDLHLPDLNGFDVLERLEANPQTENIAVIALSANAMEDDIKHALAKGFDEYITKPIEIPSFLRVISKHLSLL